MAKLSPAQIVEKQIRNARANVGSLRDGVRNTTKKPMELAAAAIPKMVRGFNDAAEQGRIKEGFDSVSDETWKERTIKGADNWAKGMENAKEVSLEFQEQIKPVRDRISDTAQRMPSDTEEDRDQRMLYNARELRKFKFKRRKR